MIMTRAPFRISFAGGGSDLRDYYANNLFGAVVSTTIDKYMYIMIHPYFHNKIRIKYSKIEDVDTIDDITHPLVRECLRLVGIERGIEIASIADIPSGTGVGSSSTFTVCLLHALYAYKHKTVTKEKLAKEACKIEVDVLKEPIGKQDQYAASYGGLNFIKFNCNESVLVESIACDPAVIRSLENNLLMFYVSNERKASKILSEQKKNIVRQANVETVMKMVQLAGKMRRSLAAGKINDFGDILHQGWLLKKRLSSRISNPLFDEYYEKALRAGAIGGKILGAGGGGFFLFYCRPKYQNRLRSCLGLRELKFKFNSGGSKIIYAG